MRDETTKAFRERIHELIDQPGACLRDNVDSLDFDLLEKQDLSTISPPGFQEDVTEGAEVSTNWVLVDTAEKMKECIKELMVSISVVAPALRYRKLYCALPVTYLSFY
jgi:hypothetical protein